MRLLELFCGSKSVSKAVGDQFDWIVNVDINPEYNPTVCVDIVQWDYTIYPPGHFDVVWASPPCEHFSCLNFARPDKVPDIPLADSLVRKTLEIIEYFSPDRYFIENPQTGGLKDREYMRGIPFIDVDYCRFSDWGYRKRTRIWTGVDKESVLCDKATCMYIENGRHINAVGNSTYTEHRTTGVQRILSRYAIPPMLIQYLMA
jgi:site-specific DNA-cytosine methylase